MKRKFNSFLPVDRDENKCWEWQGSKLNTGYGRMYLDEGQGYYMLAHRISFIIHKGRFSRGMEICHKCDNPICVNPFHLFIGTAKDNTQDALRKGRMPKRSPLSRDQVIEIKRLKDTVSRKELAKRFSVSYDCITDIILERRWKDVTI